MVASSSDTFAPGMRVGKYRLTRVLGKGGFGVVYIARDEELGRDCALKFLLPQHTENADIFQRFLQEARTAARIGHLGIVTVFECGRLANTGTSADGSAFIAMELLDGETLSDRLARGALAAPIAIELTRQIASALEAAHRHEIIHRDLKPDNVFLVRDRASVIGERVKVLDFGIAKLVEPKQEAGGVATTMPGSVQTGSMMIFGTPRYMSPEQCRSTANVDARSDVYALGVMLFEMIAGERPFDGDPGVLIAMHQLSPAPALRSKRPDADPALEELVAAMLAKAPGDRPASMAAVIERLDVLAPPAALSAAGGIPKAAGSAAMAAAVAVTGPEAFGATMPSAVKPAVAAATVEPVKSAAGGSSSRSRMPMMLAAVAGVVVVIAGGIDVATRPGKRDATAGSGSGSGSGSGLGSGLGSGSGSATWSKSPRNAPDGMVRLAAADLELGSSGAEIDKTFAWCQTLMAPASCRKDLYERERPAHTVHVSAFTLDVAERSTIDVAQWLSGLTNVDFATGWVSANGVRIAQYGDDRDLRLTAKGFAARPEAANLPMVDVTYDGARMFCQAYGLDLPTEAQWERAARGTTGRRFPWGDDLPTCDRAVFGRAAGGPCPPGGRVQAVNDLLDVTPDGVSGLAGNVSEWVLDRYADGGYPTCAAPCADPVVAPTSAAKEPHVIRGGAFDSFAEQLRGAGRARAPRESAFGNTGFRCAGPATTETK